jgi:hypothetical protein
LFTLPQPAKHVFKGKFAPSALIFVMHVDEDRILKPKTVAASPQKKACKGQISAETVVRMKSPTETAIDKTWLSYFVAQLLP